MKIKINKEQIYYVMKFKYTRVKYNGIKIKLNCNTVIQLIGFFHVFKFFNLFEVYGLWKYTFNSVICMVYDLISISILLSLEIFIPGNSTSFLSNLSLWQWKIFSG